jgi:glycosidase
VATRAGEEDARAAAVLLLTLPGPAFVYQGEEIGQVDGPEGEDRYDRWGRDAHRRPVQWTADPRTGGFTEGEPWLAPVDAATRNVAAADADPGSILGLYRRLMALRPSLAPELEMVPAEPGVVAFRRGDHVVAVNTGHRPATAPTAGELVLESAPGAGADGGLAPHGAVVLHAPD